MIGNLPAGKVYVDAGASFSSSMSMPPIYDMWMHAWRAEYYDNAYDHSGAKTVNIVDSDTTAVTIDLQWTSFIAVATSPKPFSLTVDGSTTAAPKMFEWRQSETHSIGAPEYVDVPGEDPVRFFFKEWKNGGSRVQNYAVPAPKFCQAADSMVARFDNFKTIVVNTNPIPLPYRVDGEPYNAAHAFRWNPGGFHSLSVMDTVTVSGDPLRYVFREWRQGGDRNQVYVVPAPTAGHLSDSLVARFDRYAELDVQSKYGHPSGSGWHKMWTQISFSVEDSVIEYSDHTFKFLKPSGPAAKDSLLHLFDRWEGIEGYGCYSGNDNPAQFTIYGKTTEKAAWKNQFPLVVSSNDTAMGKASVQPSGLWQNEDSTVTLQAHPKTGYRFVRWEGSVTDTASLFNVKMDTSKKVYAVFEKLTGVADRPEPSPASEKPWTFKLHPNYPNPFNPGTMIRFDVPHAERVRVEVFSLIGKRVGIIADGEYGPGSYLVHWNGKDESGNPMGSGIYFCRMAAGDFVRILKMQLIR
jgi:hypothetical protein